MFKFLCKISALLMFSTLSADCTPTLEIGTGWRRDSLHCKIDAHGSGLLSGTKASSDIHFKDINIWTVQAKATWTGDYYYLRLSADYGTSYKGRAKEHVHLMDPIFFLSDIYLDTNEHIKPSAEFYDFDVALGYPLHWFCNSLTFVPTVGFSYDRQHILVKSPFDSHSGSGSNGSFSGSFSNSFHHSHASSNYRFTWYGPYLGADIFYSLDCDWTLFAELEGHFLNNCHQKRKSHTGIYFVDNYHHKSDAYGFIGTVGTAFNLCDCWYGCLNVDYKWMRTNSKHDSLRWDSVGANVWIGYTF